LSKASRRATLTLACFASALAVGACALLADLGDRTLEGDPTSGEGGAGDDGGGPRPRDGGGDGCTSTPLALLDPELMLIVDVSGSMSEPTPAGPARIEIERQAIINFIRDKASREISGALTFFPIGALPEACAAKPYEKPAVPFGPLDNPDAGTAAAIVGQVAGAVTDGGPSPWEGPLRGATVALDQRAAAGGRPTLIFMADLATTGGSCDTSTPELEAIIADLARRTPAIRTYVIGLPGNAAQRQVFDRMARAGGTGRSSASTSFTPDVPWFSGVLAGIRDDLLCEIDLPGGVSFDPNKTKLALSNAGAEVPLTEVADFKACDKLDAFVQLRVPGKADGGVPDDAGDAAPPPPPPDVPTGRARLCPSACAKARGGAPVTAAECK
jgi:hypothetical protein